MASPAMNKRVPETKMSIGSCEISSVNSGIELRGRRGGLPLADPKQPKSGHSRRTRSPGWRQRGGIVATHGSELSPCVLQAQPHDGHYDKRTTE